MCTWRLGFRGFSFRELGVCVCVPTARIFGIDLWAPSLRAQEAFRAPCSVRFSVWIMARNLALCLMRAVTRASMPKP